MGDTLDRFVRKMPQFYQVRWEWCVFSPCEGNKKTVDLLIKYGANVNAVNNDGDTALHFAAMNGNSELTCWIQCSVVEA